MTQFPSVFQNLVADPNQNNLQSHQIPQQSNAQPMQTKPIDSSYNQQSGLYPPYQQQQQQQHQQQLQQQQSQQGLYYNNWYGNNAGTRCMAVPSGYSFLPQSLLEQIRSCAAATNTSSPIFILPSGSTGCQPACPAPTCIPYPMPLPIFHPFGPSGAGGNGKESKCQECKCHQKRGGSTERKTYEQWDKENESNSCDSCSEHRCQESSEGAVCSKKNCPASIQLQAMISQLIGIQGIIASAITRILLKRIPGSNLADSVEAIVERATRCIKQLSKEQLLKESKSSREINALLSLYMTSSVTLPRVIPILTSAQLKSNVLKALVENLINSRVMEDQGCGAEAPEPLDALLIELKSNDELRQLLALLREKECEQRVNLSFAACGSQKLIAESRLANIQRKIQQIENEIDRRRDYNNAEELWQKRAEINLNKINYDSLDSSNPTNLSQRNLQSPDPFTEIRVKSPKKLLLKPHVGSPETTYAKSESIQKMNCFHSKVQTDESDEARSEEGNTSKPTISTDPVNLIQVNHKSNVDKTE